MYLKGHGEVIWEAEKEGTLIPGFGTVWGEGHRCMDYGLVALGNVSTLDSLPILVGGVEGEVLGAIWKFWEGSVKEETNVTAVLGWPQTQRRDKGVKLGSFF